VKPDPFSRCVETYKDREAVRRFIARQPYYRDENICRFVLEFSERIPPGAEVVDIGSGPGYDVALLRKKGIQAIGIDISEAMVEHANAEYGPHFQVLDARDVLNLGENRFQGVLCVASLIHLPRYEWHQVLTFIWRILNSHGLFLLTVKEGVGVVEDVRLGADFPRLVQLCTREALLAALAAAGFSSVDLRRTPDVAPSWLHAFAEKSNR
jgi:SAM-dependent methyltransferase